MMEQYYHPELLRFTFVLGVVVSLLFYDRQHLTTGGIAVPGYLAFAIFQPLIVPAVVFSALLALALVRRFLARRILMSDSTVFSLTVVTSAALHALLDYSLVSLELISPSSPLMRGIGYIVPGLIAHDIDRHGLRQTLVNTGSATAIVACAVLAVVFIDPHLARLEASPVRDVFPVDLSYLPILILMGVLAWLGVARRHGLRCGGFIGGGYIALLLLQPWELARLVIIAALTLTLVRLLSQHAIVFGRRLFGAHMVIGALLAWGSFRWSELYGDGDTIAVVTPSLSIVGMLVAGLISHDADRVGIARTALGMSLAATLALSGTLLVIEALGSARPNGILSIACVATLIGGALALPHHVYTAARQYLTRKIA